VKATEHNNIVAYIVCSLSGIETKAPKVARGPNAAMSNGFCSHVSILDPAFREHQSRCCQRRGAVPVQLAPTRQGVHGYLQTTREPFLSVHTIHLVVPQSTTRCCTSGQLHQSYTRKQQWFLQHSVREFAGLYSGDIHDTARR
jgi:hypothetical protein